MSQPRKRRRIDTDSAARFIDDIASVDRGGEEEIEEGDLEDLIDDFQEENVSRDDLREATRHYNEQLATGGTRDRSSFLTSLEERYADQADVATGAAGLDIEDDDVQFDASGRRVDAAATRSSVRVTSSEGQRTYHVPTLADPRLYLVKVRPGQEQNVCISVLMKCLSMRQRIVRAKQQKLEDADRGVPNSKPLPGPPVVALSAFSIPGFPGHIYVEAFKEAHVVSALQGIDGVFFRNRPRIVPIDEMTSVVDFRARTKVVKKDTFVRITRGRYKGDLGYIFAVNLTRGEAMVRLVPRLGDSVQEPGGMRRPPARLFDKDNYDEGQVQGRRHQSLHIHFDCFENKWFKDGFIYKVINFRSLQTKNVRPTLDEAKLFGSVENLGELLRADQRKVLKKGDLVRVGGNSAMKGLLGIVFSIDRSSQTCVITPRHAILKDRLTFALSDVDRHLQPGDFVRVIEGDHKGETGSIVHVDVGGPVAMVIVYNDVRQDEIKVMMAQVERSSAVAVDNTYGGYSRHDLVRLDADRVAMIIQVANEMFSVITNEGSQTRVRLQEIQTRLSSSALTNRDRTGNLLSIGDSVVVRSGMFSGRSGVIKQAYRQTLFLHSRDRHEHGGIFVANEKDCEANTAVPTGGVNPAEMSLTGTTAAAFVRRRQRRRKDGVLNKTVKITRGPYKGMIGIVKRVMTKKVKIELHSEFKCVNIKKEHYRVLEEASGAPNAPTAAPQTPWSTGGALRRGVTPMVRPMTPHVAHQTPGGSNIGIVEPPTPGGQNVWNPNARGMTPREPMPTGPMMPSAPRTGYPTPAVNTAPTPMPMSRPPHQPMHHPPSTAYPPQTGGPIQTPAPPMSSAMQHRMPQHPMQQMPQHAPRPLVPPSTYGPAPTPMPPPSTMPVPTPRPFQQPQPRGAYGQPMPPQQQSRYAPRGPPPYHPVGPAPTPAAPISTPWGAAPTPAPYPMAPTPAPPQHQQMPPHPPPPRQPYGMGSSIVPGRGPPTGGMVPTPGVGMTPVVGITPGMPMTQPPQPQQPVAPMPAVAVAPAPQQESLGWVQIGMIVHVGGQHDTTAVVIELRGDTATVKREDGIGQLFVPVGMLTPCTPKKGDVVKPLQGEHRGKVGRVQSLPVKGERECIVLFSGDQLPTFVDFANLTRFSAE